MFQTYACKKNACEERELAGAQCIWLFPFLNYNHCHFSPRCFFAIIKLTAAPRKLGMAGRSFVFPGYGGENSFLSFENSRGAFPFLELLI